MKRWKYRRAALTFAATALMIEGLDELVDGVSGAAWPLIREDLTLSYVQIGLLLSAPALLANLIEPLFGLLADLGRRGPLVRAGGVVYGAAMALTAAATGFWPLMFAQVLYHPASGAFVSLTQAAWMDAEPERREVNMARWVVAGSVGNVVGPLMVGLAVTLGLGWRPVFALMATLFAVAVIASWRVTPATTPEEVTPEAPPLPIAARDLLTALRVPDVWRALWLLEAANLMMDVLRGFTALYFVDVVGTGEAGGALAVAVLTGVGLVGDALMVPLLARMPGVRWLRLSALASGVAYPALLLLPPVGVKLALLGLLGLLTSGWYAVLQARLYDSLPGRSGTAMALGSISGILGGLVPVALGALAERFGLGNAMWALLLAPVALLVTLPRGRAST